VIKHDGTLPILLGVFGSLVSVAAEFAKTVNDNKTAQRQLELQYNRVIESHGVYLALYKRG